MKDGVLYWLLETDNIEMFAEHTIYLGVTDSLSSIGEAYSYHEDSGKIEKNQEYSGVNALFTLPIDKSKASEEEAKRYMDSLMNGEDMDETEKEQMKEDEEFFNSLTLDNIEDYAIKVEGTEQTVKPDKNGIVEYDYKLKDEGSGKINMWIDNVSNYEVGQLIISGCGKREKGEIFTILVYNGNDTFTGAVYRLK